MDDSRVHIISVLRDKEKEILCLKNIKLVLNLILGRYFNLDY